LTPATEVNSALLLEPFCRVGVLEAWLQQRSDVRIVISSTWRAVHSEAEIGDVLGEFVSRRLVGMTPLFKDIDPGEVGEELAGHKREAEILAWLRAHAQAWTRWVALDDAPWLFRQSCPNLVVCDHKVGLQESDLAQAWVLLTT
jgi:hypothetical protein